MKYNILPGATAYSPDGSREWGDAPPYQNVTIDSLDVNNMVRISYPLWWKNGKMWCVEKRFIKEEEDTPLPPISEETPFTLTVTGYKPYYGKLEKA